MSQEGQAGVEGVPPSNRGLEYVFGQVGAIPIPIGLTENGWQPQSRRLGGWLRVIEGGQTRTDWMPVTRIKAFPGRLLERK